MATRHQLRPLKPPAPANRSSRLRVQDVTMRITVLAADDNESIRSLIRRTLKIEPRIELVGEAPSFAKTMQMIADLKPQVVLMDLQLAESRGFGPEFVKSQLVGVRSVVTLSFLHDDEAKILARSYGAYALLDKMTLVHHLIPTILQCSEVHSPKTSAASG